MNKQGIGIGGIGLPFFQIKADCRRFRFGIKFYARASDGNGGDSISPVIHFWKLWNQFHNKKPEGLIRKN